MRWDASDLFMAVKQGDLITLETMLEQQPGLIEARDSADRGALYWAALTGYNLRTRHLVAMIEMLVESGAHLDLLASAWLDLASVAEACIAVDPQAVHDRDGEGMTALHHAAECGSVGVASLLIGAGADVNARDRLGLTPLEHAAQVGPWKEGPCWPVIRRLRDAGAVPDLFVAVSLGDVEAVAQLLAIDGEQVHARDRSGVPVLVRAVRHGQEDVVRLLLSQGAPIDAAARTGRTSLMEAVSRCDAPEGVRLLGMLLDGGADVTRRDVRGQTASDLARTLGVDQALQMLEVRATLGNPRQSDKR